MTIAATSSPAAIGPIGGAVTAAEAGTTGGVRDGRPVGRGRVASARCPASVASCDAGGDALTGTSQLAAGRARAQLAEGGQPGSRLSDGSRLGRLRDRRSRVVGLRDTIFRGDGRGERRRRWLGGTGRRLRHFRELNPAQRGKGRASAIAGPAVPGCAADGRDNSGDRSVARAALQTEEVVCGPPPAGGGVAPRLVCVSVRALGFLGAVPSARCSPLTFTSHSTRSDPFVPHLPTTSDLPDWEKNSARAHTTDRAGTTRVWTNR